MDDLNELTQTPEGQHVILTDVNGNMCLARVKEQYWLFYQICCEPALGFGALGSRIDIDAALVIENNGVCTLNPIRPDQTPEVIPLSDSGPCL